MSKLNLILSLFIFLTLLQSNTILAQCEDCASATPINSGLVACYNLNGNANDLSNHGNNGSINGATLATDRFNVANMAYAFNGFDQFIGFGDILDSVFTKSPIAQFTVSGWAKSAAWAPYAGGGIMIGKFCGGGANGYEWAINHDDNGKVRASVANTNATNFIELESSSIIPTNSWFHFVLTFDGNQPELNRANLFVDTSLGIVYRHFGTIGTSIVNTNQEMLIGSGHVFSNASQLNNQYNGTIDNIRIYDRVLSSSEINSLFTCTNTTTGIADLIYTKKNLDVYPNPTTDILHLTKVVSYKIVDANGRIILTGKGSVINVDTLKSGIFLLYGTDENGVQCVAKFSK
jgi:hypothetical protein